MNKVSSKYQLDELEKENIRTALLKKYEKINRDYQKISHINKVDTQGLKRKKLYCEEMMTKIEKDLEILNKEIILVHVNE